jgi:hypothetical protein
VQLTILNQQGAVVAQGTSDRAGDFRFPLPPGAYRLEPESSQFLRANPVEVQVEAGTFSYVPLLYHTLIQ